MVDFNKELRRRQISDDDAPAAITKDEPIHIKYRPRKLSEIIGQKEVVRSLTTALTGKTTPHAFLFSGSPGCGKTTLSRIVADVVGVDPSAIREVNGAQVTGVDAMRELTSTLMYKGFGNAALKAIIVDECHRLSKQAWDSLLKDTEEALPHVYWFFCTSEGDKVPDAMVRRCLAYTLKPARFNDLMELLEFVCKEERYDTPGRILELTADAAAGSPGLALMMLAKVHACEHEDDAAALLETALDQPEIIDLCRLLIRRELDWPKLVVTLKGLDMPAESVRIVVANYLAGCLMNPKNKDRDVEDFLAMLEPFLRPFNSSDKMAPLLAAFGRILYA